MSGAARHKQAARVVCRKGGNGPEIDTTAVIMDLKGMASESVNGSVPTGPQLTGPEPAAGGVASRTSPAPSRYDQAMGLGAAFAAWLSRPRVRLAVIGAILLAIGGLFVTNSVWTLPLVIAGVLMVAIAWIGRRLDGHFAVEWGQDGTQLEFRAKIKAPPVGRPAAAPPLTSAHQLVHAAEAEHGSPDVIDGEAHTVEIEVSELEALIAAAQTTDGERRSPDAPGRAGGDFRVARAEARSNG